MIIYNVTTQVDHSIGEEWLKWMQNEHIPEMVASSCFTHAVILKMIEVDDSEGLTYAVQYHAESKAKYNRYIREFSDEMRKKSLEKWGNKVIAFRSVLQRVD